MRIIQRFPTLPQLCTWKGCCRSSVATFITTKGKPKAHLCVEHRARLEASALKGFPSGLSAWVLAQGGLLKTICNHPVSAWALLILFQLAVWYVCR